MRTGHVVVLRSLVVDLRVMTGQSTSTRAEFFDLLTNKRAPYILEVMLDMLGRWVGTCEMSSYLGTFAD
jgi:hypothetical protein